MGWTWNLTPAGRLMLLAADDATGNGSDATDAAWNSVARAFDEGAAAGVIALAMPRHRALPSGPAGLFWRSFADAFLGAMARATHSQAAAAVPVDANDEAGGEGGLRFPAMQPMGAAEASEWVLRMPEMRGAEYASPGWFETFWLDLMAWARGQSAAEGGVRAWLGRVHPGLHALGRVTFHLVENKRTPPTPFAFLATYVHRLSEAAKPVHLPLARALQEYAGAGNKAALQSLLEPVRRAAEASDWARDLLESRRLFQPQAWTPSEAYGLLREVPALESSGIITRIPDWWRQGRGPRPKIQVRVGDGAPTPMQSGGLLSFSVEAALGGEALTEEEWQRLMSGPDGLVSIRGQWVEVDRSRLSQVMEHWRKMASEAGEGGVGFLEGMRLLSGFRPGAADAEGAALAADRDWAEVAAGTTLREALADLGDPSRAARFDPNEGLDARLRPYQETGVRWLWLMQRLGLGACLADDMGLGKTLQVIGLLVRLKREEAGVGPSLLVAPASLLANWMAEIKRFAPELKAVCLHGTQSGGDGWKDGDAAARMLSGVDVAITTYGQAMRLGWLSRRTWRLLVLDEAQAIKNPGAKQTRSIKAIPARARIALSGTPVENRLGDLWSLFDFLNPGLLGAARGFGEAVERMRAMVPPDYSPLRRLVGPYLLRRLKTDKRIIADLPDKTETETWCVLSKRQAVLYQQSVRQLSEALEGAMDGIQKRGLVLAFLMRFKQVCNHPSQWLADGQFTPEDSGKFQRLAELCEEIASRQERVLVFTQFREMTAPISSFLSGLFGREGLTLDGTTPVRRRQEIVQAFQREDGPPFLVLSLKAGGTGLTLTAANHVIHFDRWWNPAVENQATDRAFRIGQRRNVLVHKFVCRGTVEERIHEMLQAKRDLADAVLGAEGGAEALISNMSNDELLRFVALDMQAVMRD